MLLHLQSETLSISLQYLSSEYILSMFNFFKLENTQPIIPLFVLFFINSFKLKFSLSLHSKMFLIKESVFSIVLSLVILLFIL